MSVVLEVVDGPRKGLRYKSDSKVAITIGRSKTNDFHILDSGMSRVHAVVARGSKGWFVEDQKSSHGLWMDNQRVENRALENGATFRLGKLTVVRFSLTEAPVVEPGEVVVKPRCAACGESIVDEDRLVRGGTGRPYHVQCRNLDHLVGTQLGEFKIVEEIDPLGDAFFFRAHQPTLKRAVVLEVFDPPLVARPGFRQALLREVRRASKFLHPNILQILDYGEARGTCFVVMEHFNGQPLLRLLEERRYVQLRAAVRLAIFEVEALRCALEQGAKLNWVRPNCVLVSPEHAVKLKLFNEPRARGQEGPRTSEAAYVSPEALAGECQSGERSLVYSVGAQLYHMLAGIPPFEGGSVAEIAKRARAERPPALRRINLKVSPSLATTVEAAIHRDPDQRPGTLAELHDALQRSVGPASR